ncbi:hypothetical protein [Mesobacillus zeae]|uniref:hypothetical protein n=1 Tax=Mesobacillus zeae TaxID=1917180 RepID=UPI00300B0962
MNQTIATFMKIAITVVSISAFLFYVGYNMIGSETTNYKTDITSVNSKLPTGAESATNPNK